MRLLRKPLPLFNYPHSGGVSRAAKGADCKSSFGCAAPFCSVSFYLVLFANSPVIIRCRIALA